MSAVATAAIPRRSGIVQVLRGAPILGPVAALLLACIFFTTQTSRFLSGENFSLILQQVVVVGTLAIGQTLVILTGGIDLSNGMIMALSSVLMTGLFANAGLSPVSAILVGLGVCLVFGVLNGWLTTAIGLPPFIVTLGTFNIAYALVRIYTTATVTNVPASMLFFGNTFKVGSTEITYGTVADAHPVRHRLVHLALHARRAVHLRGGRQPRGGAPRRHPHRPRLDRGLHGGRGELWHRRAASRRAHGRRRPQRRAERQPRQHHRRGAGGTSLLGGRGELLGTLIGALIVGVFRNGLQLMGVGSIYQVLITGVLVILAVSVDYLSHRTK